MPATLIISLLAAPIQRIVKILQVYFLIHKMGLIVISPLNVVVMDTGNHYHSEKKKKSKSSNFTVPRNSAQASASDHGQRESQGHNRMFMIMA